MNLQQMRYAVAIANSSSFREAAQKLYTTQPSLSQGIKDLEEELGVQLFLRSSKGVQLTPEGALFVEHAESILNDADHLVDRFQNAHSKKRFSVSTQHYDFLSQIMIKIMEEFKEQYDEFRLFESTTLSAIKEVADDTSEIGILYQNEENRKVLQRYLNKNHLVFHPLGTFETHIFVGKHHPLAKEAAIELSMLEPFPQIRFTQEAADSNFFAEDILAVPQSKSVVFTNDRSTLMNFLTQTNAYASGSGIVTGFTKKEIRLIPLKGAPINTMGAIAKKDHEFTPIAERFLELAQRIIH
ncbi:LysR family transcriptional regulator [Enterococcus hirae]|jgi:DNA-binding transcriptional LysR family regulator|nr:LysR family transcriptional regulator [Enterococcaceae bacterium]MCI1918897.1 LysR family transcriptional regulator [Enterococcaceae bacterium]MDM8213097.1 LysR family transcriptional regulator [Enterococcus hirae]